MATHPVTVYNPGRAGRSYRLMSGRLMSGRGEIELIGNPAGCTSKRQVTEVILATRQLR